MSSTLELKKRIGSVKNTKQITKAMELVAASKLRRAQDDALKSRAFYTSIVDILSKLAKTTKLKKNKFYIANKSDIRLLFVFSSDRGLAGAYNANVLKYLASHLNNNKDVNFKVVAVGKKAAQFLARVEGNFEVIAEFEGFGEKIDESKLLPLLSLASEEFLNGSVGYVDFIYTNFISSLKQEVKFNNLLPISFNFEDDEPYYKPILEPNSKILLDYATRKFVESTILQALYEASASEHSSRMFAMKNASDNASDLIDDLTLAMNSARQAAITQELAEISAGTAAVS